MNIDAYLERIAYQGSRQPVLETLCNVHRAHLTAIAYENLDIHLGRGVSLEIGQIYDKIVQRGRGGWCYEMNSLLAWALGELGFEVNMLGAAVALSAAVGATTEEERQHLDHMALRVVVEDEPWLLDVGFGTAFIEPLPLREGVYQQAFHTFKLQRNGEYWSFHNHEHGVVGFEFLPQSRTIDEYATRCRWLQTSPDSPFVKFAVCHRLQADHTIFSLWGAVLTTIDARGKSQRVIDTFEAFHDILIKTFGLQLEEREIETLWAWVWPAHLARMQTAASN